MNLFSTLASRAIAASDSYGVELDEYLFRNLLLALLARRKHVIVRGAEEDIPLIVKEVVHILHAILSLSVLKLKFKPSDKIALTSDTFLRLLFLRLSQENDFGFNSQSSRPGSRKASGINESLAGSLPFKRSSSYPNTAYSFDEFHVAHSRLLSDDPSLFRSQTDPSNPFMSGYDIPSCELPQALVVTGLEHTSLSVQEALWRVMSENRFSLAQHSSVRSKMGSEHEERGGFHEEPQFHSLDDNFLVVYVCPIQDGRERPFIHHSLIDRFAFCVDLLDFQPSAPQIHQQPSGKPTSDSKTPQHAQSATPVLTPSDLAQLQRLLFPPSALSRLCKSPVYKSTLAARSSLLLADLIGAVRHHPHLEGILLTARCHEYCIELVRAHGLLFGALSVGQEPSPENVTDDDVRRVILLSAVAHRIRVRDGPEDELLASALYPAVREKNERPREWKEGRRTVREVLKEILEGF